MFSRRKRTPRSQSQRPQTAPGKPQAPGRPPEFYARQATRTVRSRTFWLMLVMGILVFVILFFQLYHLQITRHKELQTRLWTSRPARRWFPPSGAPSTTATAVSWRCPCPRRTL